MSARSGIVNKASTITLDTAFLRPCTIYIGTGGTLKVKTAGGSIVTFNNLQDGTFLPVEVVMVYTTGTSASDLLALYREAAL